MMQNKRWQRLAVFSLPWLLAGCLSLDPDYQRPTLPVTLGDSAAADHTDGYPQLAWRDYITDARLRQVVALSLDGNRDLREAIANIAAARALYAESRASLLPTLDAGLDGSRSRALTGSGNATAISQSYQAEAGTSAFELDLFGKNRSQTRAQYESYLSSAEAARSTRLTVIATVVEAWIALAADRSNLAAAQDTAASAQRSLTVTRNNQRHGIVSLVDVASAETVYQAARADVAEYATLVEQDNNALVLAVGQPVAANLLPDGIDALAGSMKELSAGVSSQVLLNRPDVLAAEHTLKAANADIGAARAAFFPTISLTASGGVGSASLSSLFSRGAGIWSFAPSISLPIFSGGYNAAALDYANAQQRADVASYEKTVQTAFQEVSDALARRATLHQQLSAQRGNVAAAQQYAHLAELRYRHGVDSYLNLLTAQRTLYSARQSLIAVQQTHYQNLITLYKVMGGGSARPATDKTD